MILNEVSDHGLMRDEQFVFRPRHSTSLQLARLAERITRNFGEKRITGTVFFNVSKAFDTVWINGLLTNLTIRTFPSYLVQTISLYLRGRTFEPSFQTATSSRRAIRAGVAQGAFISPFLSVCMSTTCPHPRTTPSYPLRGRDGHRSHVSQTYAARQLPGILPQRPSTVVE